MSKREVFEYCLYQLLDRFKEKALKELAQQKLGEPADMDWTLEDITSSDFTNAMVRLGIISFHDERESAGDRAGVEE